MFMGQYLKEKNMAPKNIVMADDAHAQTSNAYNFCLSKIQLKLQECSWNST